MVAAMFSGRPRLQPASAYLTGKYGLKYLYLGVPALIGSQGLAQVIEIPLNHEQLRALHHSAEQIREGLAMAVGI